MHQTEKFFSLRKINIFCHVEENNSSENKIDKIAKTISNKKKTKK